jgi:hypothetical protein
MSSWNEDREKNQKNLKTLPESPSWGEIISYEHPVVFNVRPPLRLPTHLHVAHV